MKRTNTVLLIFFAALFTVLLVGLKYEGSSTDSTIYNKWVEQLAAKPFKEILNPEWRDINPYFSKDEPTPYVRDHYPGQFLIPTLVAKLGFPASHILYIFNIFYKLVYLYLLYLIISHFVPKKDASFILYSAFFSILSFNYLIRSDHEQPVLLFSLLSTLSGLKISENKKWFWASFIACGGAFFVKGLATFYVPVFGFIAFLIVSGFRRELFLLALSTLSIPLVIGLYEIYFRAITGLPFFEGYWKVQLSGRTLNQITGSKLSNLGYYFSRGLIYSLPWSAMALILRLRKKINWERDNLSKLYLLIISLIAFVYLSFSLFNRTASRYVYVGNFLLGILCILYVYFNSPWLQKFHQRVLKFNIFTVMILTWGSLILMAIMFWYLK